MSKAQSHVIREWLSFTLALIGCILGLLGFFEAKQSQSVVKKLEINSMLDEAWDKLGGQKGTDLIKHDEFVKNKYQVELACRLINAAKIIDNRDARVYWIESAYHAALGYYDKALESADMSIELDPHNARPHQHKTSIFSQQQKWDEALQSVNVAIRLSPDDYLNYSNKCFILFKLGRFEEAENAGNKAIELYKYDPTAYYNLALVLQNLGKNIEADRLLYRADSIEE